MRSGIKTKLIYRIDGLENLYVNDADSTKYKYGEVTYNQNGDILKELEFDADENQVYCLENRYDEKGRIQQLERAYYGELAEQRLFSYTDEGLLLTEKVIYTNAGEKHTHYTYTEFNKPLTKLTEDLSGEDPLIAETFEYQGKQLVKHCIYQGKADTPHYLHTISYEPGGEIIQEESIVDAATGITTIIKNNLILAYRGNKLISRITRTYNDKEQLAEELTEDLNGRKRYSYQYDDTGNLIIEERYLRNKLYFKVICTYKDKDVLLEQTVIDPENGSYTEYYDYIYDKPV